MKTLNASMLALLLMVEPKDKNNFVS